MTTEAKLPTVGLSARLKLTPSSAAIFAGPPTIGALIALVSLSFGASPVYVTVQVGLFLLLTPLFLMLRGNDPSTPIVLIASFFKTFYISQVVCALLLYAPDAHLSEPVLTAICLAVGLIAGMLGISFAGLVAASWVTTKPVIAMAMTPNRLNQLGYVSGIVGLIAQAAWTYNVTHTAVGTATYTGTNFAVISFLTPLTILSLCCYAASRLIETRGRSLFSVPFVIVLALYLVAIAPLASKNEPLTPLVAVTVTAVMFRWKPGPVPILVAAGLLMFVATFLFPVINYARMTASAERQPTAVVFAEVVPQALLDSGKRAEIESLSRDLELGASLNFYDHPLGFLDRFTPAKTDRLVASAQYVEPVGPGVFKNALISVLPQSLGFKRDQTSAQVRMETGLTRKRTERNEVSWENIGYVGDGYFDGGFVYVALFMFVTTFCISLASRYIFGTMGGNILWIPLMVNIMLYPADGLFETSPPQIVWKTAFYVLAVFAILRYRRLNLRET